MNKLTDDRVFLQLKEFRGKNFAIHGFEFGGVLWLLLDEVLQTLQLTHEDLKTLQEEEPEDFETLADGRVVIKEGGFYFLALFVSETPEAKELSNWLWGSVMPSIAEKGYYRIKEERHGTINHQDI